MIGAAQQNLLAPFKPNGFQTPGVCRSWSMALSMSIGNTCGECYRPVPTRHVYRNGDWRLSLMLSPCHKMCQLPIESWRLWVSHRALGTSTIDVTPENFVEWDLGICSSLTWLWCYGSELKALIRPQIWVSYSINHPILWGTQFWPIPTEVAELQLVISLPALSPKKVTTKNHCWRLNHQYLDVHHS